MMSGDAPAQATLSVCITCRRAGRDLDEAPCGQRMLAALAAAPPPGVTVRAVECLSACDHSCSVALQAPGKWTYIYSNLDPDLHAPDILRGAGLYALTRDGIVPWRDRPQVFRKQSRARVPPLEPT